MLTTTIKGKQQFVTLKSTCSFKQNNEIMRVLCSISYVGLCRNHVYLTFRQNMFLNPSLVSRSLTMLSKIPCDNSYITYSLNKQNQCIGKCWKQVVIIMVYSGYG